MQLRSEGQGPDAPSKAAPSDGVIELPPVRPTSQTVLQLKDDVKTFATQSPKPLAGILGLRTTLE